LATSAVSGLNVVTTSPFGSFGAGDFDSALLTAVDGSHWIIRAPRNQDAENTQSTEMIALRALSAGVRARLPFALPSVAGQAPLPPTRAVVYEFVFGGRLSMSELSPELAESIGIAIAAIHSLPTSVATDVGLPRLTAADALKGSVGIVDRASATGLVPSILLSRWERAVEDESLWQFQPTVIHGSLASDALLTADDRVSGILNWADFKVGDPASDLKWLLAGVQPAIADVVFESYAEARQVAFDNQVRQRTMFYAELELARWLLHGTGVRNAEIVDDAIDMMDKLVDLINNDESISPAVHEPLDLDQVEELLESPPPVTGRSGSSD
jgi:aminoglycoside phosphotransferase (APT) family kinase protein